MMNTVKVNKKEKNNLKKRNKSIVFDRTMVLIFSISIIAIIICTGIIGYAIYQNLKDGKLDFYDKHDSHITIDLLHPRKRIRRRSDI